MKNESEQFHRRCGEILRSALEVESSLDSLIPHYFCYPQHDKTVLLYDSILRRMGFERKIEILKEICKKEGIELPVKVIDSINFVKDKRNRVAHHEAHASGLGKRIVLQSPIIKAKSDRLELGDELVKEVKENRLSAIEGIVAIDLELFKRSKGEPRH